MDKCGRDISVKVWRFGLCAGASFAEPPCTTGALAGCRSSRVKCEIFRIIDVFRSAPPTAGAAVACEAFGGRWFQQRRRNSGRKKAELRPVTATHVRAEKPVPL